MAKEILLYGDIWGYSAEQAVAQLDEARNSQEITVRFNGDGGEVRYGWAIIAKAKELKGKKIFKNDGEANSMMAFAFCYNDDNEALDVSVFKFHRASWGEKYEAECASQSEMDELKDKNAKLRAAMEAKMDIAALTRLKNITLDEFFATPGRTEFCLNATEALECKLINRITPITPEYKSQVQALASFYSPNKIAAKTETVIPTTMTIEEIKSKYPDAYKAIYAKGKQRGIEIEFDRANSCLACIDADQKGAIEAFKSGKPLTQTQMVEFAMKLTAKASVAAIENESAEPITTKPEESKPVATAKAEAEKQALKAFNEKMDQEFQNMYPKSKKVAR